ncbi:MAG: molybdopterin-dependent oxidoreductase, partial [Gammaproteobacteria bacterium]|nr:molybdopterin-dependent oxidoreductase [Gammaproteobacteria bacterium]
MKENKYVLPRRGFLKLSGSTIGLSLVTFNNNSFSQTFLNDVNNGNVNLAYKSWEDIYAKEWTWDKVSWGSHNNQCLPAACSFRVYSRNGVVWREEQNAQSDGVSEAYPDYNPMGCQKGCAFHNALYSEERLRYPLKRVGKRGGGKWKRVSWDQALTEIADAILDAHEDVGSEGFHIDAPHLHAGSVATAASGRMGNHLGAVSPDTNVAIGDDLKGISQVFGKMRMGMTSDNMFDAEVLIFSQANWSYTAPPMYHFITEARYNGSEVILVNPDFNASTIHADIHVPVLPASDAALWLSVSQVMIEEKIYQEDFVLEQTDLPVLVRMDNAKFLSAAEIDGGRPDQLYFYDNEEKQIVKAPRAKLQYDGKPELDGQWQVTLKDGSIVQVETVFRKLKKVLNSQYTPEVATKMCGVTPTLIRKLARKIAGKRTHFYCGFSSAKHYHGDLMERAALLMLGLSGNWGKPGTGFNNFLMTTDHVG